ncbi:MAG: hypothetical protein WB660_17030 [Candidatus Sulfotelmatobacter sp.]
MTVLTEMPHADRRLRRRRALQMRTAQLQQLGTLAIGEQAEVGSTLQSSRQALAQINAVPRLPSTLGDDRLLSCRRQNLHGRLRWRTHGLGL